MYNVQLSLTENIAPETIMQNGDAIDAAVAPSAEPTKPEEVTKRTFRQQVWKEILANKLAASLPPRFYYQRIPNMKSTGEAADILAETDAFKNSGSVFVNHDKAREIIRLKCLEHKKTVYIPGTHLSEGYLTRIEPPADEDLKKVVTRKGMLDYGKPVGMDETVSIDLVIVGAVAVSKQGYHIGSGRGYSDLEFAILCHMKALKPTTLVVTVVHDSQVFDTLPAELFGPHDVPVDLIVTNTQVIETQRMSQRPTGIMWHLLSSRKVEAVPLLGRLREIEIEAGRPCPLKEVDTETEERSARRGRPVRARRYPRNNNNNKEGGGTEEDENGSTKPRRGSNRRASQRSAREGGDTKRRAKKDRTIDIDFSVKLSNITRNTRVRDLKQALTERGVKPDFMVWKGFRGFCYLHFFKNHKKEEPKGEGDTQESTPPTIDSVISALKELQVTESRADKEEETAPPPATYVVCVEPAPPRKPREPKEQREVVIPTDQNTAV